MAFAGSTLRIVLVAILALTLAARERAQAAGPGVGAAGASSGASSASSASASSASASSTSASASSTSAANSTSSSSAGASNSGASDGGGHGPQIYGQPPSFASYAKPATRAIESAINACGEDFLDERKCIADALDAYAEALRKLPLPPDLSGLPAIVSRAAHRVRAARTKAEAAQAIKLAIAEVHKTIALLKADDSAALRAATRDGSYVAETLIVADYKLEKAVGL
ncbi:MAG TPA: hypothetical protein VEC58_06855 [Roseiarcus sp.]|nr:hypothetical protein [Roseiarcus sp.]